jgi:hypothetical protein
MPRYEIQRLQGNPFEGIEIALGDDERVLQIEDRKPNDVIVYVLARIADGDHACGVNGCSRSVTEPDDRCWQHQRGEGDA